MNIVIYFSLFIIVGERQERRDLWKFIVIMGRKIQKIEESIFMNIEKNLTLLRTLKLIDKKISKNINNFSMYSYQEKMNHQYNLNIILLVMIGICGIFLAFPLFENIYTKDDSENSAIKEDIDKNKSENNNIIPNQYIIYLNDNKQGSNTIDPIEFFNSELKDTGTELLHVYDNVAKGFAIKVPNEKVLEKLKDNPSVKYIGQDKRTEAFTNSDDDKQKISIEVN
ncbi:MAG: protease inhibitor I9 family protein [Nitrososphaeraceae archaeon]